MREVGKLHVESCEELWSVNLDDPEVYQGSANEKIEVDLPHYTCYTCGNDSESKGSYCPHCGDKKEAALAAFEALAHIIDDVYPDLSAVQREDYHSLMTMMRLVNPEFREMWYNWTTEAARRRANG